MTILATTAAPSHRDRSRSARARGFLVNLGLTLTMLVALAFLLPSLMGLQRYVIMGGSMEGTYDLGSIVLSEVVPVSELEVGDVITYVPPAESGITTLVTHRIVSIDGEDLRTQGDANPAVDPWTFQLTAATQPRVVAHVPYAGYVFMALADRGTQIIVCCGSGGVGKTTTSAALALRAAERGRKVVVLTIDPARRLAQSMGIEELDNTPRPVADVDATAGGSLDAMMLDMKSTFDEVVLSQATPEKAKAILENPFYIVLSTSFAGTQEYSTPTRRSGAPTT